MRTSMINRPRMGAALAAGALTLALGACGSSSNSSTTSSSSSSSGSTSAASTTSSSSSGGSSSGKKLGLLMDVKRNDRGFGTATYAGAQQAAKAFGLKLSVVEGLGDQAAQAATALNNFARDDDYIVDGASATYSTLTRVAKQFPDKQFSTYAVQLPEQSNLHAAYQDWYPLGYLAGVTAASTTKSGVIGFVGGGQIPPTIAGQAGYIAGAKSVKPDVKIVKTITGDFDDATKGKDATQAEIAQKADVVYSFLDGGHAGAVAAAKAAGNVKLLGVIFPKCSISQGLELGDSIASQTQLIYDEIQQMVKGTAKNATFGVQDPKVASFQFCPGQGSTALKAKLEQVRQDFDSGKLKSPKA